MGAKNKLSLEDKKNKRLKKWLMTLNKEQKELLTEYCNENSQRDLDIYFHAYERVLRPNLYILADKDVIETEKIYAEIIKEIALEGINLHNFKNGAEYMKKLNEEKQNIINKYNILLTKGKSEKEIMSELKADYPLFTPNSIKNVIIEYKREKTKEKIAQGDTDAAVDYIFNEEKKVEENAMTKKDQIIGYLKNNSAELSKKGRQEIAEIISEKFGVTYTSAMTYYYDWKKANPVEEKKTEVVKTEEPKKEKFKILKKFVSLDIAGEFGEYHIENGEVTKDGVIMKSADEVKKVFEEKKQRSINLINRQADEVLELMEMYK